MPEDDPMTQTSLRLPLSLQNRVKRLAEVSRRKPADMHRVLLEDAVTAAEVALGQSADVPHTFTPKPGNALRCGTCGVGKGQHPKG